MIRTLSSIGTALPPAIDAHIKRANATGAPLPLVALNVHVPARPIVLDHGGPYTLTVHGGPAMSFTVQPKLGRLVDTIA
ncbi:MAG: hypothetical protein KF891_11335 [Rhizobacter sp.]|nr:hypothetical protein [Rhizobacter sp.]